jgi:hypothetical protein
MRVKSVSNSEHGPRHVTRFAYRYARKYKKCVMPDLRLAAEAKYSFDVH